MNWDIQFTNKSAKQARQLDEETLLVLQLLVNDLRTRGPIPGNIGTTMVSYEEKNKKTSVIVI